MTEKPRPKLELFLCMGSACHQMGVYSVLPRLQQLLREHGCDPTVELKGAFCLEKCSEGIALQHGEDVFIRVNPANLKEKFLKEILPSLKAGRRESYRAG